MQSSNTRGPSRQHADAVSFQTHGSSNRISSSRDSRSSETFKSENCTTGRNANRMKLAILHAPAVDALVPLFAFPMHGNHEQGNSKRDRNRRRSDNWRGSLGLSGLRVGICLGPSSHFRAFVARLLKIIVRLCPLAWLINTVMFGVADVE
ncbi:hypothetical protein R1flu_005606 [Riccia fluitans]|uniref:Uncharacterized protein n=1 Tax=Riccia fluitans TaxID=41844 RepID=A0ABD1YTM5_9MARC